MYINCFVYLLCIKYIIKIGVDTYVYIFSNTYLYKSLLYYYLS